MKKYEEEHYRWENIREDIYPWIKESLVDHQALNGKYISDKDTPLISFVGDLMIVFVIRREGGTYEILKDNMLPPESDMEQIYHIACENLVRDVEFVISHTWYGGFGIVADGIHEASSLCFKHIWNVCAEKLGDDIAIMAPSKDMVLFVPAKDETLVEKMRAFGEEAFARSRDKISRDVFIYTKDGKELLLYGKSGH
ncbi:MAG: hypothetical protein ACLU97_03430 [Dorea sp.]|nr:hypothetical protein [Faecalimonas umbilicata]